MKPNAVLIPTYNSAATLRPTLESLLAQDLSSIDAVYLADDASSDATIEIARAVWQSPTPLIVISQSRNQGERHNVNTAIRGMPSHLAWIHILHSDDLAKPQWLTAMTAQIDRAQPTVASICSSWDDLNADGSIKEGENEPDKPAVHVDGSAESVRSTLKKGCWWHISGCAIRLAAFRNIGDFTENLAQTGDWEWLLRCLRRGWGIDYIPQTLIMYRLHGASVSSASFREHRDVTESLGVIKSYAGYLTTRELCRLHTVRAWSLIRRTGHSLLQRNPERARKALFLLVRLPAHAAGSFSSMRLHKGETSSKC